jgi:hypothetical protein
MFPLRFEAPDIDGRVKFCHNHRGRPGTGRAIDERLDVNPLTLFKQNEKAQATRGLGYCPKKVPKVGLEPT